MEKGLVFADIKCGGCSVKKVAHIEQLIERKRMEMYEASDRYGLLSSTVLEKSQELDVLLNHYQQIFGKQY